MTGTKPYYFSRTMWLGFALIVKGVGEWVGVHVDAEALADSIIMVADPLAQVALGVGVMWGRARAEKKVTR